MTARLGWGTYRVRDIGAVAAQLVAAGARWVDTAPNYACGRAQKALAPVLAEWPQVKVSTKVGYLTPEIRAAAQEAGVLPAEAAHAHHCLHPDYVRWQVDRNLTELGRRRIDVVFVHNPEHAGIGSAELADRLLQVFGVLEEFGHDGRIGGYGVATWHGFRDGFTASALVDLAEEAARGGIHHLVAVQLPVSLIELGPVAEALDGYGPLVDAPKLGLQVFASAPLGGGELPAMVTPELAELIRPGLTAAQAALAVVASAPGVDRVLLSAGSTAHWEEAAAVAAADPVDVPALRKILDVLS